MKWCVSPFITIHWYKKVSWWLPPKHQFSHKAFAALDCLWFAVNSNATSGLVQTHCFYSKSISFCAIFLILFCIPRLFLFDLPVIEAWPFLPLLSTSIQNPLCNILQYLLSCQSASIVRYAGLAVKRLESSNRGWIEQFFPRVKGIILNKGRILLITWLFSYAWPRKKYI